LFIFTLLKISIESLTALLISVGSLLAAIFAIFKYINKIKDLFKKIFKINKNFKNHKIFDSIEDALRENKLTTNSTYSLRNKIAILLKNIKLEIYQKNIKDFVDGDLNKIGKDKIIKNAKDLLVNSMEESNKEFKKNSNNKEEEKTAQLIIDKYKYFEVRQIENAIEIINEYKYDKIKIKELINSILSIYQYIVTDIVNNTKETISKINGDITGLYFMNEKIEPHNDKI
jgi:hypothetical protein